MNVVFSRAEGYLN